MPSTDYTGPGNYSWTSPFATRNLTATCIGGGGSGYKDKTDNESGGGGGGAGFGRSTRTIGGGHTVSIRVGNGGARPGNQSSNNGQDSYVSSGLISVYGYGGRGGRDGIGGDGSGGAGDVTGNGENGQADSNDGTEGGRGGGAGKPGGNAGGCGGRPNGGQGVTLDGGNGSCTGGRNGGQYGGGGGGNSSGGEAGGGGNGAVRLVWDFYAPTISYFNGSTQRSSGGTPSSAVTLSWATQYADNVSISELGGQSGNTANFNAPLQSNANGNSPASKTYTLTASGPGGTVTATATVYVYNDNTPSNSWTTSFINLEPNVTDQVLTLGVLSGVDMPTLISVSGAGNFVGNTSKGFSGSRLFDNGDVIQLKTSTLGFNTDISGLSSTATFGKTNSKTVSVSTPGGSFNVTVTTRAPRIKEDFDMNGTQDNYPYEDIDLIANSPTQNISSSQITANDIEIAMEIKVDNPDIEISINNGSWQNARSM